MTPVGEKDKYLTAVDGDVVRNALLRTRREFLGLVATGVGASVAGCPGTTAPAAGIDPQPATPTPTTDSRPGPGSGPEFDPETVQAARTLALDVRDSVLVLADGEEDLVGTGWYYADRDLVVTAGHVAQSVRDPVGWLPDGRRVGMEKLGATHAYDTDVGALRADVTADPLPAGDAAALERGQPLVGVGHPAQSGYWTIALGRFRGYDTGSHDLRATVPASGGFSGGPVLTLDGAVVGHVSGLWRAASTPPAVYGPDDALLGARLERIDTVRSTVGGWTDD